METQDAQPETWRYGSQWPPCWRACHLGGGRAHRSKIVGCNCHVVAVLLVTMGIAVAVGKSTPAVTYYGCLHDGTLTKVGTTSPKCTTKGSR